MLKRSFVLVCCLLGLAFTVIAQDVPDEIDDFDDDWEEVIEQLDDSGYISEDDGELIFEERRINFDDADDDTIYLEFNDGAPSTDFVLAATLQFDVPSDFDEYGFCVITFRDSPSDGFLAAGIDTFESVILIDNVYDNDDDVLIDAEEHGEDYDDDIHLIVIGLDDEVTVYANGELLFEDDDLSVRSAAFGLLRSAEADCEAEDIWIWELESSGRAEPDTRDNDTSSSDLPDEIDDYDGASEDVIDQLVDEGILGSGNAFLFGEDYAFIGASGSTFTSLGRNRNRTDIVMAGELTFDSQSRDYEQCGLLLRVDDSLDPVQDFLYVGFDSDGDLFIQNNSDDEDDTFDFISMDVDLDDPQHLIMIARGETLDVYVNGELIVAGYEIYEVRGIFGVAQISDSTASTCEARDIWVYDTPFFEEGVCNVVASGNVNKRSGPGTNFDRDGQMNSGETLEVEGQTEGDDGFIWYELEDGSYVREDIISLVGDCSDIDES